MQLTKKLPAQTLTRLFALLAVLLIFLASGAEALAHNVAEGDKGYIQESSGALILPFIYLGAKHMVTGYDQAMDNLGAFQRWFGFQPSTKAATLVFGFFHGFGLATKIIEFDIAEDGLVPNLLAFNVGVEIGQLLALGMILILRGFWRRTGSFRRHAFAANTVLMAAGFMLVGYQLVGFAVA